LCTLWLHEASSSFRNMERRLSPTAYTCSKGHCVHCGCMQHHLLQEHGSPAVPHSIHIVYTLAAMKCPLLQEHGPNAVPHSIHLEYRSLCTIHCGCMKRPLLSGTWSEGCPPQHTPGGEVIVYSTLWLHAAPSPSGHGPKAVPHSIHLK
jgi:hypothetical protein